MIKRITFISAVLLLLSTPARAVYFPGGIDWANPAQNRFVLSLYLNVLGRAPDPAELRTSTRQLARSDTSETRLEMFKNMLASNEYRQIFRSSNGNYKVYRAPDYNYNSGRDTWRYQAAEASPEGFRSWELSGKSSQPVAEAMAHYYDIYCYNGTPCVGDPQIAKNRGAPAVVQNTQPLAHACADESNHVAEFRWMAVNGTTYPRGTDAYTLCMGEHYYQAVGSDLQRYQCDSGYLNCQRDAQRDIKGQRNGLDRNGDPAIFFADGSRLILTNYNQVTNNLPTTKSGDPLLVDNTDNGQQHSCADPTRTTSLFRWRGSNGVSESPGIDNSVICMDNYFYVVNGVNLRHYDCAPGFRNCTANPSKNIKAEKRKRVDGYPGLEFRNGTTLALVKRSATTDIDNTGAQQPTIVTQQQPAAAGQQCADPTMRLSQFRWTKNTGEISWPDGIDGRYVCMNKSYYEIDGFTLRHYKCNANFGNCRANPKRDLIATGDSEDSRGYRTLTFANGDQLSLVSR